jgi:erythronate-4-phosphate dehydrogenase
MVNDPPRQKLHDDGSFFRLEDVLSASNIITLHVPLTALGPFPTLRMVDKKFISKMKPGAVLINTSRGAVIDEESLRDMRGRLGGYLSDVWCNEPDIDMRTVDCADIATPHIAGYSFDGKINGTAMIYDAACSFFSLKKTWQPSAFTRSIKNPVIDVSQNGRPVYEAVKKACDLQPQDRLLRLIASVEPKDRAAYYDNLRKEYPQRREFGNYTVKCGKEQAKEAEVLRAIGFMVE